MKRIIALVLSLVMALSLCAPAWGAEVEISPTPTDLPVARVTPLGAKIVGATAGIGGSASSVTLDAAYQFQPTETLEQAQASDYRYWHADFVVYADKDVAANSVALAGYYEAWCSLNGYKWVALTSPDTIPANTEIRLVQGMGQGSISVNYEELCRYGNDGLGFLCGVADVGDEKNGTANTGTTITVELRLYETEDLENTTNVETGRYVKIATVEYTFGDDVKIGNTPYETLFAAVSDAKSGDVITLVNDIVLPETVNVKESITIDGNGKTIGNAGTTNTAFMLGDSTWGADKVAECNITLKNAVFDGWETEHVVRMQGVTATIDSCTFQYCKQEAAGQHGLVSTSAVSNVTVQNCTFDSNECTKAIHFDDNAAANTLVVKNNTFTNNTVSSSALVYFSDYGTYSATGNTFEGNTVAPSKASNAGIIYGAAMTVTGNTFKNNSITNTSARGGVVVADAGTINENVFSGNTITVNSQQETTFNATIVQKGGADTSIDANANYWSDGKAAVEGEDYVIAKDGGAVVASTYYTTVSEDGKLSGLVDPNAPKPPVYYPPVVDTPTETPEEKPVETPTETPAQTPVETPTVDVTVPVGGNENTVKVEATVTGTTATVDKVDVAELETVIGSDVDTGKVVIDFSTVAGTTEPAEDGETVEAAPVDTVEIPAEVIAEIAEAVADPENNAESLEIVLGDGASIEFDAAALAEKVAQAGGEDITISIKPTTAVAETLSSAQLFTVGEAVAFDITVTSGGVAISDMGGNITISAPYELSEGETAEGVVVYYVDDEGNREKCETFYDAETGRVSWVTNHLSVYMVSYEAPVDDGAADDGAVDETPADDAQSSGSPALWVIIAVVVIVVIVAVVIVSKKRKA